MSPGRKDLPPPAGADSLAAALRGRLADRPAETPAEPPTSPPPAAPNGTVPAPERAVAAPAPAPPAPDITDAVLARWRQTLNAYALKTVAARKKADAAVLTWDQLLADAAAAGVPEGLIAAAADAADPQRNILARPPA